jgi:hypothetical protein
MFCEDVQNRLAILPRSPQLRQNGGLTVLSSNGEIEKSRVDGDDVMLFSKKVPGKKV